MRKKESILTGSQSSIFALSEQAMAHNALLGAIEWEMHCFKGLYKKPLSCDTTLFTVHSRRVRLQPQGVAGLSQAGRVLWLLPRPDSLEHV
jgi:hypothetical protein